MKHQVPWLRVLVEGVVIVGSILLAFGIQAAWDERQERQEEYRLLQNLRTDFTETRQLLAASLETHGNTKERALSAAEFGLSPDTRVPPGSPQTLARLYINTTTTRLKTGALDGALSSGRLDLITNDELRSMLAGWPRLLTEFSEQETFLDVLVGESRPALAAAAPIAEMMLGLPLLRGTGVEGVDAAWPPSLVGFLTSEIGQNYSTLKAQAEALVVRDGAILLATVDDLLALIDGELE